MYKLGVERESDALSFIIFSLQTGSAAENMLSVNMIANIRLNFSGNRDEVLPVQYVDGV